MRGGTALGLARAPDGRRCNASGSEVGVINEAGGGGGVGLSGGLKADGGTEVNADECSPTGVCRRGGG